MIFMPLTMAKAGHSAIIKTIVGSDKTCKFLSSLGCTEGEEITLISIIGGNYIISVKDSRYAIDKNMAKAIDLV
jgi:ferrous iron transport protein A